MRRETNLLELRKTHHDDEKSFLVGADRVWVQLVGTTHIDCDGLSCHQHLYHEDQCSVSVLISQCLYHSSALYWPPNINLDGLCYPFLFKVCGLRWSIKIDRIELYGCRQEQTFSGTWWLLTSGGRWRHPMNSDSDDPEPDRVDPTDPVHFNHSAPLEAGGSIHWREVSSRSGESSPLQQKPSLTSPSIPLLRSLFAILDRTNFASHLPSSTSL